MFCTVVSPPVSRWSPHLRKRLGVIALAPAAASGSLQLRPRLGEQRGRVVEAAAPVEGTSRPGHTALFQLELFFPWTFSTHQALQTRRQVAANSIQTCISLSAVPVPLPTSLGVHSPRHRAQT